MEFVLRFDSRLVGENISDICELLLQIAPNQKTNVPGKNCTNAG